DPLAGEVHQVLEVLLGTEGLGLEACHLAGGSGLGGLGPAAGAKDMEIRGPGADVITVRRDSTAAESFRIFNIDRGYTVQFSSGPVEVEGIRRPVVVCDGESTATKSAEGCLIVARRRPRWTVWRSGSRALSPARQEKAKRVSSPRPYTVGVDTLR